jgi:hypothetical protein
MPQAGWLINSNCMHIPGNPGYRVVVISSKFKDHILYLNFHTQLCTDLRWRGTMVTVTLAGVVTCAQLVNTPQLLWMGSPRWCGHLYSVTEHTTVTLDGVTKVVWTPLGELW